jgi:glutamate-1-semialdehyde 2,1-aminomutase
MDCPPPCPLNPSSTSSSNTTAQTTLANSPDTTDSSSPDLPRTLFRLSLSPFDAHGYATSLPAILTAAHAAYTARNPASHANFTASIANIPSSTTQTTLSHTPFPLTIATAHASTLTTLDSDTYVDFFSNHSAALFGHTPAPISHAVTAALAAGINFGEPHPHERALAAAIRARFSPTLERVRFARSGTEANRCALGAAVAWTGRRFVLVFRGGHHDARLALPAKDDACGWPSGHDGSAGAADRNLPHMLAVGVYNDIAGTEKALVAAGVSPTQLAAVLVEPMLGAVMGQREFLGWTQGFARGAGALLVLNEVTTSRLAWGGFGAEIFGLQPDLLTLGTWIGGGLVGFGAFGGRADVMDGPFGGGMGGLALAGGIASHDVLGVVAGRVALELFDRAAVARLNRLGGFLRRGIEHAVRTWVLDPGRGGERMRVSGYGSIMAVHFCGPHRVVLRELFFHHMLVKNIYLAPTGFIALNLETTSAHVEALVAAVEAFVARYEGVLHS